MFCDVIKSFIISLVQTTVSFAYNVTCKLFFGWPNHVFHEARLRKTHLHKGLRTAVYAFFISLLFQDGILLILLYLFVTTAKKKRTLQCAWAFLILCKVRNSIHIANVFKDWYCFFRTAHTEICVFLFCYCYKTVYFFILLYLFVTRFSVYRLLFLNSM